MMSSNDVIIRDKRRRWIADFDTVAAVVVVAIETVVIGLAAVAVAVVVVVAAARDLNSAEKEKVMNNTSNNMSKF